MEASKLKRCEELTGKLKQIIGNDALLEIAKQNMCPHYLLLNPITKEEVILFYQPEINEWIEKNYVHHSDGMFTSKFDFIFFDKDLHRVTLKDIVPRELRNVRDLYKVPVKALRTSSGIYFLCNNNKIVYIGKAINVTARCVTHVNEGKKDFDSAYFISCPTHQLDEMERAFIKYFQPSQNGTCLKGFNSEHKELVENIINVEYDME